MTNPNCDRKPSYLTGDNGGGDDGDDGGDDGRHQNASPQVSSRNKPRDDDLADGGLFAE